MIDMKASSHGAVRGSDFDRRSSQFEGRFGRIFRSLPAATWSEAALHKLAGDGHKEGRMSSEPERDETNPDLPFAPREDNQASRLHDDEENSGIDAGYTYLGQFIDHDITFDPASSLQQRNDVDALVDFRTPRLDLDCLYGRGPDDQPYMYDGKGRKFQLGRKLLEGVGGKVIAHDLPRHSWTDSDGKVNHRALIGDKRNDENVIVSQLPSVFLQFHNRLADDHQHLDFSEIQRKVRWHYQYVVLHDFLYKIARQDIIESVLPHLQSGKSIFEDAPRLLFYKPRQDAFMPIEFAAAAYRFGHSMVRPIYRLNTRLSGGNQPDNTHPNERERGIDGRQFIFAGLKERGLNGFDEFPQEWGIDWNLFFDLTCDKDERIGKDRTQPAYKIDTSLVNPLAFLPEFSQVNAVKPAPPLAHISQLQPPAIPHQLPNLALRNLLRGRAMGLPSGQDVARAMGVEPLDDELLKVGKATTAEEYDKLDTLKAIDPAFKGKAPLWYYVLAEAQNQWLEHGGRSATPVQLGVVGSRIVVETLVGLLLNDGESVLRQAPAWRPCLGKI
ncbi:MAG: heme peroxidase family protein [Methylobacter sp.]|nr:heme peroxidase family protein [Methylobacter sp.]